MHNGNTSSGNGSGSSLQRPTPNLMQDGSTRADRSHHGTPIGLGHDRLQAQDRAERQVGARLAQGSQRGCLRQVLVMQRLEHAFRAAADARRMLAGAVAEIGMHRRLVQDEPGIDPVAETLQSGECIFR